MSITIYTYQNPYKLNKEAYWDEINSCPYFCVSQTLVNGLRSIYEDSFPKGQITTTQNLIESMFEYWMSTSCAVKQHADIDNTLSGMLIGSSDDVFFNNIASAFKFNRGEVFKSIRTLSELNIDIGGINKDKLSREQQLLLELYQRLLESKTKKDFILQCDFNESIVNEKIITALWKNCNGNIPDHIKNCDRVVIHGVHQFSPTLLRAIEILSAYKKVILLFNYQSKYRNLYQTWIDIYSEFDCPINTSSKNEYLPEPNSKGYKSYILARNLAEVIEGNRENVQNIPCEIIEFDNMTEFSSYVADIFKAAQNIDKQFPMEKMSEQIYAADSSANNILRIYFPEQFGEMQFLDYPLGHFFLSIANMWDSKTNEILISDMNDIKECMQAGILKESFTGELSNIFERLSTLFYGCTTIDEMLVRLKKLRKNQKHICDPQKEEAISHIVYYSVSLEDIAKIENALRDLDELAAYFYEDFEKQSNNFKEFYKRLKNYLQKDILLDRELDEEFADIIRRVLDRLEEVQQINASASFECLKSTMSLYLVQETKPGKSANWIVRNFEQIDGDIIRRRNFSAYKDVTYHFACLTDEDINSSNKPEFSWPLNSDFFEVAHEPIDWKVQVYVKAKKEYKNFKRCALIYGLEFNQMKFKLSYIRRFEDKERNPYYLLKLLGINIIKYQDFKREKYSKNTAEIDSVSSTAGTYTKYDYFRYRICEYRFLLESLFEKNTIYKDNFLLTKYLEVLIESHIREDMQGFPVIESVLIDKLNECYDEFSKYFPFLLLINRIDIVNSVKDNILNSKIKKYPILSAEDRENMMIKELFLHKQLSDPKTFRRNILIDKFPNVSSDEIKDSLSEFNLKQHKFIKSPDLWCKYCPNREICAAFYSTNDM